MNLNNEEIYKIIALYHNAIEEVEKRKNELVKAINAKISAVRKTCKHDKLTYHPDPSGNNDSCQTCDICGIEKRRF